jgi:tRNA pseudouridine55 synthase
VYRARVRLGITTETYDAAGAIVARAPVEASRARVKQTLDRFRGKIEQLAPMYSAVKHEGTPLYRLARRGTSVERKPRTIEVFRLEMTAWEPPECTLEMTCSPGTYVRTLAHDLGQALGCGAHLAGLVRLASGCFRLEDAVTLKELERAAAGERWTELLHPIDAALAHLPALHLDEEASRRLCSGQAITASSAATGGPGTLGRAYGPQDTFLAVVAHDPAAGVWRPQKVFCPSEQLPGVGTTDGHAAPDVGGNPEL